MSLEKASVLVLTVLLLGVVVLGKRHIRKQDRVITDLQKDMQCQELIYQEHLDCWMKAYVKNHCTYRVF